MEEKKIERPLILRIDDAKKEIVQCFNNVVNEHQVPFYILNMILSDVCKQVVDASQTELSQAQSYVASSTQTEGKE